MVIQLIQQIIKRYQKIKSEIIAGYAIRTIIGNNKKRLYIFLHCICFLSYLFCLEFLPFI